MNAGVRASAVAVLAVCFVMNMLARGASETFAVYLLTLEREFQSTRSELTGVYSVFMLVNGLASPLVGMAFDRFGPRASYGVGLLALALAYALASRAHALWQLYLSLGVLVGIGVASLSMVTASGLISRWFRARLGTAMGLAYAGYGLGVIAIVPLSQVLIAEHGWRHSYWLLSCAIFLVVPVFALLPWRRWAAGRSDLSEAVHATRRRAPWTVRAAARDSAFWGLFAVFFFTSTAIYSATVQAVVYLVDVGFTPLLAATAFGFIGFLSTLGMGSAGWLCDRFGPRLTVSLSFSFTVAGLFMLMCLVLRAHGVAAGCQRVRLRTQCRLQRARDLHAGGRAVQRRRAGRGVRRHQHGHGAGCRRGLLDRRTALRPVGQLPGGIRSLHHRVPAGALAVLARAGAAHRPAAHRRHTASIKGSHGTCCARSPRCREDAISDAAHASKTFMVDECRCILAPGASRQKKCYSPAC